MSTLAACLFLALPASASRESPVLPRFSLPLAEVLATWHGQTFSYRYRFVEFSAPNGEETSAVEDGVGALTFSPDGLALDRSFRRASRAESGDPLSQRRIGVYHTPTAECSVLETVQGGGPPIVWLEHWIETPPEMALLCGVVPEAGNLPPISTRSSSTLPGGARRDECETVRGDRISMDYDAESGALTRFVMDSSNGIRLAYHFLGWSGDAATQLPQRVIETRSSSGVPQHVRVLERMGADAEHEASPTARFGSVVMDMRLPGVPTQSARLDRALPAAAVLNWMAPVAVAESSHAAKGPILMLAVSRSTSGAAPADRVGDAGGFSAVGGETQLPENEQWGVGVVAASVGALLLLGATVLGTRRRSRG